jgi:hypothetical protein
MALPAVRPLHAVKTRILARTSRRTAAKRPQGENGTLAGSEEGGLIDGAKGA